MNFTSKNPSKQDTLNAMMREIQRRKADYAKTTAAEVVKARQDLIAAWRAAHPDAAKEAPSAGHRPLDIDVPGKQPDDTNHPEIWNNDIYQVTVRRWTKDPVFGMDGGMIQIGINALDGTARHDWRDFQGIKNQIAGPECEAFEMYRRLAAVGAGQEQVKNCVRCGSPYTAWGQCSRYQEGCQGGHGEWVPQPDRPKG